MKKVVYFISAILVLGCISVGAVLSWHYYRLISQPLPINHSTALTVKSGTSTRGIGYQLVRANILPQDEWDSAVWLFELHVRINGYAGKLKAGDYVLDVGMTLDDVIKRLVSGQIVQYKLTLIEGKTFKEIVRAIKAHPNIQQTLSDADYASLMPLLGQTDYRHPEGWFFPDTYNFPKNTTDKEFLQRSYTMMHDYLMQAWEKRVPSPYLNTPYEALILASIVEKETGVPEERPLIAGLFFNRLAQGMLLQTDPTVIYGMGDEYNGNLRKADLQRDTPYNSYTRKGLPPTPIATPSAAAIDAVMHPASTNAIYFVATGKGGHEFSRTYAEHQQAVARYLQVLRQKREATPTPLSEPEVLNLPNAESAQ